MHPLALAGSSLVLLASLLPATAAVAAEEFAASSAIEITATRIPELVDNVPASISLVTGEELRARGATDLRTALSLVAGVEGTPGGDSGPAGVVPALWGLREADAFLLVVDNVPWGGAFNPATPSVDLTGIERIEILRGSAPVMYGATSFVGVIHVLHHAPGQTPSTVTVSGDTHGSGGLSTTTELPALGEYRQSLAANFEKRGYAEDRTEWQRYHLLYRSAVPIGATRLHVDGDVSILPQDPPGNLLLLDGSQVHSELPLNVNFNPAGAKINQQRYHLAVGLDGKSTLGDWAVTLAATRTLDDSLRGFLRGDAFLAPPDAGVGDGLQADGYSQTRGITDIYIDTHLTSQVTPTLDLTYGIDHLYGSGSQHAINFGYCIDPAGQEYSCIGARHADEIVQSTNRRDLSGIYAQMDWKVTPSVDVLAGLRLNQTNERATGRAVNNSGESPVVAFDGTDSGRHMRLTGVAGASWHVWKGGHDTLTVYADYRNSFKPLSTDFGPEAEVSVLKPETADSYEVGAKSQLLDGALDVDSSLFRMKFRNSLTFADNGRGHFLPANGGETRFQGFEIETHYTLTAALQLTAHYANHDARIESYTLASGANLSGNRIEMSPRETSGVGLVYTAPTGFTAALVSNYSAARYLNKANTVVVGGYATVDASLGYRSGHCGVRITGHNLSDRRDPVAASELQRVATVTRTTGFYRMPSRTLRLSLDWTF